MTKSVPVMHRRCSAEDEVAGDSMPRSVPRHSTMVDTGSDSIDPATPDAQRVEFQGKRRLQTTVSPIWGSATIAWDLGIPMFRNDVRPSEKLKTRGNGVTVPS